MMGRMAREIGTIETLPLMVCWRSGGNNNEQHCERKMGKKYRMAVMLIIREGKMKIRVDC